MATINEVEVEQLLRDCVNVEPLALNEEFVRLAADVAYWNERYVKAQRAWGLAKLAVDKIRGRKHIEYRESLPAVGKKVTEALIEASVEVDEELVRSREALIDAEAEKTRMHGILQAIYTKRDMVIQLGAQVRQEMKGDPQLRVELQGERLKRED